MPKPGDDLSALFRSLGPDDANFQAATNLAAREATQRWPLLMAIAPQKQKLTPALSAQERQLWRRQEKAEVGERKPALSLPGSSGQMAKSLSKMSGRLTAAAVKPTVRAEAEVPPSESPHRAQEESSKMTPSTNRGSLFSRPPAVDPGGDMDGNGLGLFASKTTEPMVAERDMAVAPHADDSLASVFSRLEEKEEIVKKPADNRSSFLGRLGKR